MQMKSTMSLFLVARKVRDLCRADDGEDQKRGDEHRADCFVDQVNQLFSILSRSGSWFDMRAGSANPDTLSDNLRHT